MSKFIPMGCLGEPNEIKGIAVYLAADASSYVTGQVFVPDGGLRFNCCRQRDLNEGMEDPTGFIPEMGLFTEFDVLYRDHLDLRSNLIRTINLVSPSVGRAHTDAPWLEEQSRRKILRSVVLKWK